MRILLVIATMLVTVSALADEACPLSCTLMQQNLSYPLATSEKFKKVENQSGETWCVYETYMDQTLVRAWVVDFGFQMTLSIDVNRQTLGTASGYGSRAQLVAKPFSLICTK